MRTVALNRTVSVTLDGSGNGTASAGPTASGETWQAGYVIGVRCATNTAEAQASAYAGPGVPAGFLGTTTWGSTGDSNSDGPALTAGQLVTASWKGGDPGTTAYLTVTGSRLVP